MAKRGWHARLAPGQVENFYLADDEDVAQAKADFAKVYQAAFARATGAAEDGEAVELPQAKAAAVESRAVAIVPVADHFPFCDLYHFHDELLQDNAES